MPFPIDFDGVVRFIREEILVFGGTFSAVFLAFFTERAWERHKESKEARQKTGKVLDMTENELQRNLDGLEARNGSYVDYLKAVASQPIGDARWRALEEAGALEWIDNLDLLGTLSDTYASLGHLRQMEDAIPIEEVAAGQRHDYSDDVEPILAMCLDRSQELRAEVEEALETIEKARSG